MDCPPLRDCDIASDSDDDGVLCIEVGPEDRGNRKALNAIFAVAGGSAVGLEAQLMELATTNPSIKFTGSRLDCLPVNQIMPNFAMCVSEDWLPPDDLPDRPDKVAKIMTRYTKEGSGASFKFYMQLNVALAMDYKEWFQAHTSFEGQLILNSLYIRQLCCCIQTLPGFSGQVYRGANLSDVEIDEMKRLKTFVYPAFMSTSSAPKGTLPGNVTLEIDCSVGERVTCDILKAEQRLHVELTHYKSEKEVLLQCNSKFEFVDDIPAAAGRPRRLKLKLLDRKQDHGELLDLYHMSKYGKWDQLWESMSGNPHKELLMAHYSKRDAIGWTMLHQAAWWGNRDAAERLIRLGADPSREDNSGCSSQEVKNTTGVAIDWSSLST